jgi:acetyl-CoA C-acetyltransferase
MYRPGLDPRTPILVGVGQWSERLDSPDYTASSAVELAAAAAREALADTGAAADVAKSVEVVAGVRQFEISSAGAAAPLGRSDNYPRSVARRVGADPRRAVLEVAGGQSPQHLVNEFSATIAEGEAEVVLLFGSEAISTTRHLAMAEARPDFTEHVDGDLEDRGYGTSGIISRDARQHGLTGAPEAYALFENARRARLGLSREEYARAMGALFAPFTRVAAQNPHAAAPVVRSAADLVTPSEKNRPIADPYTRYLVARDQVNQGAALLLMSVGAARRLAVPPEKWVFLHGHCDLRERELLERSDLSASPASILATQHALEVAGLAVQDVDAFDFYSCFPIAVFTVAVDGLGLAANDPRGLTLAGGLPYFGGAGNNYSMHAIAEAVQRARSRPGAFGLVGANGGLLSKYSVGVYSTAPAEWRPDDSATLQAEVDSWAAPKQARRANGWGTIEAYTVKRDRQGQRTGIVVGRLEADGRRFFAATADGDDESLELLTHGEPIGQRALVKSTSRGNRIATTRSRMSELYPTRPAVFRHEYEHVLVRRDGRVLEIAINRPEQRNALTPPASEELDQVFDAYFADPDLWVAILTGVGETAFCAGNDLLWTASGKPSWLPENGFAGLTSRRSLPKPVIAAVNGFAMGGGCETALACHLVVADENATFALSEVKVGLVAGAGGLVRLPREVPRKLATEMILTGRRLTAQEALHHGLVNRVVAPGAALEGARSLAEEVLASSPTSVRVSLAVMEATQGVADTVEAVLQPSPAIDDLLLSEDMREGVAAFAQKRRPKWKNR